MNHLLPLAIRAAIASGADIMAVYDDPSADFGIELKADNSPLTRADKAAHNRIASLLAPTGIPLLSEEGRHMPYEERRQLRRLWIVDPLDGTKEFIKRNGEFTVNIALVEEGTPVLGVIYVPVRRELYAGLSASCSDMEGSEELVCGRPCIGAWKSILPDGLSSEEALYKAQPLPLPDQPGRGYVCVASRSHLSAETASFIDTLRHEHPDLQLVSSGSSLKICRVAEGTADVYPRHAPTMEWDTAAGDAIARAAGCSVVDVSTGSPLTYNKADLHNPWFIVQRGG